MRPRRDPVPRAKDAWVWLGGLAMLGILGGGVTAAAYTLWERIDIRQLVPALVAAAPGNLPLAEPPTPAAREERAFGAVIFDSPRNARYFPESGYYDAELDAWRALASGVGAVVRSASDAADLRGASPEDVLVLVEAPCLSTEEVAAVRAHLGAGGGVVANWGVGARDENCDWLGWQVVSELTGAEDVRELPARRGLFFAVPGGVALSPGLDPGARVELRPDPSLALRLTGPRVYWSDWALNPSPDEQGGGADAAAVTVRTPTGGRVAWYGFRQGQAVASTDSLRVRRLIENGMLWAAGVPFAAPAPWPGGSRAALMVAFDVEDQIAHAGPMADMLRERDIPTSFYVVSQLVQSDSALAVRLESAGEVGSQTTDHTPVFGLTPQDQRFRLRRSWTDVETWTGEGPSGLHPPEETFDANTLEAWRLAGGRYLVATNEARSASPEVHATDDGSVVLLPRLVRDDYNLIVQERVIRAATLERALLDDVRKMYAIGGLAVVAGHTQIMRPGPRPQAFAAVADSARAQGNWWLARGEQIAEWWRARADTRLAFVEQAVEVYLGDELTRSTVPDVLVAAPAEDSVAALWVDLVLPIASESMRPLVNGAAVDFETTEWGMRVPVPALAGGDTARISIVQPTATTAVAR